MALWTYIAFGLAVLALILGAVMFWRWQNLRHRYQEALRAQEDHQREQQEMRTELQRLEYLLENQKAPAVKKKAEAAEPVALESFSGNHQEEGGLAEAEAPPYGEEPSGEGEDFRRYRLREMSEERRKLQEEKEAFAQKNRKLWEQSLTIGKEKERINQLRLELEEQHTTLRDSIYYAKRIQDAMLPDDAVLESILPRHFIFWVPRDIVSGDYYWVRSFGDRVVIMVADCTGHGVPGAFMSLLGMSFLNELVSEMSDMMPHLILEEMRRSLKESLHQTQTGERPRDGMDAALCVWDRRKMKAYFSGAKNPLFLLREGHLHSFKGSICPIGFHPKETGFETEIVDLEPGDWLYMFSDGFKDQFGGPRQKKINAKGFKDQLLRMYEEEVPITQQGEQLAQFFHEWKGEGRQIDDVLVFGFEAVPKSDSA